MFIVLIDMEDLIDWCKAAVAPLTLDFDTRHIVGITNTGSLVNIRHVEINFIRGCPPFSGQREKRR